MESDWLGKWCLMPQNRTWKVEKVQDSHLMKTERKMAKIFTGPNLNIRNW